MTEPTESIVYLEWAREPKPNKMFSEPLDDALFVRSQEYGIPGAHKRREGAPAVGSSLSKPSTGTRWRGPETAEVCEEKDYAGGNIVKMIKCEKSSSVDEFGYDPATKTLRVKYVSGPAYYDHAGVEPAKFLGLQNAPSKGQYMHANIRSAKDKDGQLLHPVVPAGLGG